MKNEKWDQRFLELAKTVAQWSKDPSTKVGSVVTEGNRIVSLGYNGFAAGVKDDPGRYDDRSFKYPAVIHAEINSITYAKRDLTGCTIYTWPMPPCASCAAVIIQCGISRVVSIVPTLEQTERWGKSFLIAADMYEEAGVRRDFYGSENNPYEALFDIAYNKQKEKSRLGPG